MLTAMANPLMMTAIPAAACAAAGALAYVSVAPKSQFWGPVVHRGDTAGVPRYALTFDDGPSRESTSQILDILSETNAKAAFFVIGVNARRNPDIIKRMHAEGHVIANHSFDHSHLGVFRTRRYWERQVQETDDLIQNIIGIKPAFFRPPMGIRTGHVQNAARRNGHTLITWSRRGIDGVATTPQRIVARLADSTCPGDILVLHDGIDPHLRRDPSATVAAVGPLILALRNRGLMPVPLDELIGIAPYAPPRSGAAAASGGHSA
jgi:peptidoglycan/xylan/chitin deacetylase (PgdA/CDA1 family)